MDGDGDDAHRGCDRLTKGKYRDIVTVRGDVLKHMALREAPGIAIERGGQVQERH